MEHPTRMSPDLQSPTTIPATRLVDALNTALEARAEVVERLLAAIRIIGPGLRFSTSLGLEDQAVLHAITEAGKADGAGANGAISIFTLDTGRHFPETLDVIAASETRFGTRINVFVPEADDLEPLVARDGIHGFRLSVTGRQACCDVRKVRPLRRALAGASGWITGLRRGQSQGRADVPFAEYDPAFGLIKVNPLADWSLDQLNGYIHDHDIPVNALHAQGFPSIGCQPCTRAVRPGEDIRAGRWWWEQLDGKECGLHGRNARPPSTPQPTLQPSSQAKDGAAT
jgi:phosphoadenosine phosphosulfate reductase